MVALFRWPKLLAATAYADTLIECYDFEERRWKVTYIHCILID